MPAPGSQSNSGKSDIQGVAGGPSCATGAGRKRGLDWNRSGRISAVLRTTTQVILSETLTINIGGSRRSRRTETTARSHLVELENELRRG